jgi:hypothetical protein
MKKHLWLLYTCLGYTISVHGQIYSPDQLLFYQQTEAIANMGQEFQVLDAHFQILFEDLNKNIATQKEDW